MLDLIAKIRAIIDDIPATPGTKSHDLLAEARTKLDRLETVVLKNPPDNGIPKSKAFIRGH